jgi:hypothetical protein
LDIDGPGNRRALVSATPLSFFPLLDSNRVKAKSLRKIDFHQFLSAIEMCATSKRVPVSDVVAALVTGGGPKMTGKSPARATKVRLHDDKAGYAGR